jgi:hypothetical protein
MGRSHEQNNPYRLQVLRKVKPLVTCQIKQMSLHFIYKHFLIHEHSQKKNSTGAQTGIMDARSQELRNLDLILYYTGKGKTRTRMKEEINRDRNELSCSNL